MTKYSAKLKDNYFISIFLGLLLLLDLGYSYYQYSSQSYIDGDFAYIVLGAPPYDHVLGDPLGISALHGESYPGTNRFTAHAVMSGYFKIVPHLLQVVLTPLNSLYTCIAITKLLIHVALLFLLSYYAISWKGFNLNLFLFSTVILSPFFQAGPVYYQYMAIIDGSITYVMFYALPMVFLLVYFLPFYRYFRKGIIPSSTIFILGWLFLTLLLVLFGPLPAPIILIFSFILLGFLIVRNFFRSFNIDPLYRLGMAVRRINKSVLILLTGSLILSLYSLYIGSKNSENNWTSLPMEERFTKLTEGMKEVFLNSENGLFYLFTASAIFMITLYIFFRKKEYLLFKLTFFLLIFAGLYLFLLPLGGYRIYRPLIVKHDTLLPVLMIGLFIFATCGILLLKYLKNWGKVAYIILIIPLIGFYSFNDKIWPNTNECEKRSILEIAKSNENCVILPTNCTVGMWKYNFECSKSELPATLFKYYNIFPRKILYRFEDPNVKK